MNEKSGFYYIFKVRVSSNCSLQESEKTEWGAVQVYMSDEGVVSRICKDAHKSTIKGKQFRLKLGKKFE